MRVYLDHNATTPMRPEVRAHLEALQAEAASGRLGNASSVHASGRRARALIDEARERVAAVLRVPEETIVFTSGGTQANNLALSGSFGARTLGPTTQGRSLVVSAIEHAAVLDTARALESRGVALHVLDVNHQGFVDPDALESTTAASAPTLVSVMAANNEIGVVQDLETLAQRVRRASPSTLLHTDAVQALGRRPIDLRAWDVDLATFSAHKVGGPLGIGVLYTRRAGSIEPVFRGGDQEAGLWPGTENVPGISAAALAFEFAERERDDYVQRVSALAQRLWDAISTRVTRARIHGPALDDPQRLCNTLNVALPGKDGRVLVTQLDLGGLEVSAGSACASGSIEPSHVLRALGLDDTHARSGLRISLGRTTTAADVEHAAHVIVATCAP